MATLNTLMGAGMGEIDTRTIDGLKATLVRALEQGDADWLDSGTYLAVVRRQDDGSWRYATDMWNSDQS